MSVYYATGEDTHVVREFTKGWVLEYNPNIKMYRLNRTKGPVPLRYQGYSPHPKVLMAFIKQ